MTTTTTYPVPAVTRKIEVAISYCIGNEKTEYERQKTRKQNAPENRENKSVVSRARAFARISRIVTALLRRSALRRTVTRTGPSVCVCVCVYVCFCFCVIIIIIIIISFPGHSPIVYASVYVLCYTSVLLPTRAHGRFGKTFCFRTHNIGTRTQMCVLDNVNASALRLF